MRVVVNLQERGTIKSYVIDFGSAVTRKDIEKLLVRGEKEAAAVLLAYSRCLKAARKFEILPENRAMLETTAEFILNQNHTAPEPVA